jgi:hypothetical protein
MANPGKKVIVTGDITLDWILARSRAAPQHGIHWDPQFYMQSYHQFGGAALLGNLIQQVAKAAALNSEVLVPELKETPLPGDPPYWHSYTTASRFQKVAGNHGNDSGTVWRLQEFLGLDRQPSDDQAFPAEHLFRQDSGDADIIVLSDANEGYRNLEDKVWPQSLKSPKKGAWLLLKLSRPNFSRAGDLAYIDRFEGRVIVVIRVNDLRLREMQISRSLSWERTAADIIREMADLDILDNVNISLCLFRPKGRC